MIKDRELLEQYLIKQCELIVLDVNICKKIYIYAHATYNIPRSMILDIITKRIDIKEAEEFVLFILLDSMCKKLPSSKMKFKTEYFYSEQKIEKFSKMNYETQEIKIPLKFKMIEIVENQHWLGKITANELMELRRAQLIHYNINTQRTAEMILGKKKEIFEPIIYPQVVDEIQSSLENNTFIPDPITLNIPADTHCTFEYDKENGWLIIKELEYFDIVDGYQRYIAVCREKDKNSEFDYPFELRIFNFTENKAKQFKFQEEQKVRIRKIDSVSMNMNKASNIVVERLNKEDDCRFKGLIDRNNGIILFAEFSEMVNYFYFKKMKITEATIIDQVTAELKENLNILAEHDSTFLKQKMDYKTLMVILFCFVYFRDKEDKEYVCEIIDKVLEKIKKIHGNKFREHIIRKPQVLAIENIVKEVI